MACRLLCEYQVENLQGLLEHLSPVRLVQPGMHVGELVPVVPDARRQVHPTPAQHVQSRQLLRQGHRLPQRQRKRRHPEPYPFSTCSRRGQGDEYLVHVGRLGIPKPGTSRSVEVVVAPDRVESQPLGQREQGHQLFWRREAGGYVNPLPARRDLDPEFNHQSGGSYRMG